MFLEAQFGADAVSPIALPKLAPRPKDTEKSKSANDNGSDASMDESEDEEEAQKELEARQKAEIERLHRLGIPVPGVQVKVDNMVASVWLEDLEVECGHKVFADRVRAVVERAVEVTAPLWI